MMITFLAISGFSLFSGLPSQIIETENMMNLAEEIYRHNGGSIPDLIALYKATENQDYLADLKAKVKELVSSSDGGLSQFRNLAEYLLAFPDADEKEAIKKLAQAKYEEILSMCDKYFGVR